MLQLSIRIRPLTEKIKTTCASCGKTLVVPAAAADKQALCKACRENSQFEKTIAPETRDNVTPDTVTLGKSLAATKLIKDVLNVEPSVDLEHMPGTTFDSDSNLKPEESGKSIRDIISQAKKDTKYIVDKIIGQGGMGAVLGTIDQDIRRKVAMKVMLPENRSDTLKSCVSWRRPRSPASLSIPISFRCMKSASMKMRKFISP